MISKGIDPPENYNELDGKKITYQTETSFEKSLKDINKKIGGGIALIPCQTGQLAKQKLLKGNVYGIVLDADEALNFNALNDQMFQIAFPVSNVSKTAWAVEKGNPLKQEVENFFEIITINGILDEIFYKKFEIPILKKEFLETKNATKLLDATTKFINNYSAYINNEDATVFNITVPKIVFGDIASGDKFIKSLKKIKKLNKALPTAICVEMEGAAVAQICYEYNIPFSIIRIISDKANDNATIDFSRFAKSIASYYALGILKNYFNN